MIEGTTKNIILPSVLNKDIDDTENFIGTAIDLYNVRFTNAGHWFKRPGYLEKWDVGIDRPIDLLIPNNTGYAICNKKIYKLGDTITDLSTSVSLTGSSRPQYLVEKDDIMIVDGGTPIEITPTGVVELPGSPSNFRFITTVGSYTIGAGHTDRTDFLYEFMWSAAGNYENWTTGDSGNARVKKTGAIMNITDIREKLFILKTNEIEIWYNAGGATPFARITHIEKGLYSSDSMVNIGDTFYWLGHDKRYYRYNDAQAELVSQPLEKYIQGLNDKPTGFHNEKEHLIHWVYPSDGVVLTFDYINGLWSIDSEWNHGQWERIPMASYMEVDGVQYFGSFNNDGKVYKISENYKDDNGTAMRVFKHFSVRPSPRGNNNKFNKVGFRCKRGVGTVTGTIPVFSWRARIDKGDWSPWDEVSLGTEGDNTPYIERTGLGVGEEIEFQIMESDAVTFSQTDMDLTVRELGR